VWNVAEEDRRYAGEVEADWPRWISLVSFAIPLAILIGATAQRHAIWPPRWPTLFAVIALLPFAVDALTSLGIVPPSLRFPPLLFAAVVIGAVTPLSFIKPISSDVATFAVVMLVGEMASRLKWTYSAAIALVPSVRIIQLAIHYKAPSYGIWVIAFAFAWVAGTWMQMQTVLATRLREAQSGLAEQARREERSRIAREVHDVIAHSMSVTMLHLTAARMALEQGKSSDALDALREAETQGRNSLADIRLTVGLLGSDTDEKAPPMPTVSDLPRLVGDFRNAGLDVELDMSGDIASIAPAAGLNIYRIAQESLTNVSRYAEGSHTTLELNVTEDEIRMRVRNTAGNGAKPRQTGNGLGIPGMVERASSLGGSLRAGPESGGWLVSLQAPRSLATA
jgi:signal transduction histidine kinase